MLTGDELEQMFTVSEVATIMKKYPDTEMMRADQIEAVRIGRTYRMRKSVVEKLIGIDQKLQ